jgi:hypothetical protein
MMHGKIRVYISIGIFPVSIIGKVILYTWKKLSGFPMPKGYKI